MGRRRDNPEQQAAKGFPGKRRSKTERQIHHAEALAAQMAAAPAEKGTRLAPPAFLTDPRLMPALTVWRDLGPELEKLNLLHALDRYTFAAFCYWVGEYNGAVLDILENGYSKNVRTVSGDLMPRRNPNVYRRDTAFNKFMDLADEFGLTPLARHKLIAQQSAVGTGALFGHPVAHGAAAAPAQAPSAADDNGLIGGLAKLDSAPPPPRPN